MKSMCHGRLIRIKSSKSATKFKDQSMVKKVRRGLRYKYKSLEPDRSHETSTNESSKSTTQNPRRRKSKKSGINCESKKKKRKSVMKPVWKSFCHAALNSSNNKQKYSSKSHDMPKDKKRQMQNKSNSNDDKRSSTEAEEKKPKEQAPEESRKSLLDSRSDTQSLNHSNSNDTKSKKDSAKETDASESHQPESAITIDTKDEVDSSDSELSLSDYFSDSDKPSITKQQIRSLTRLSLPKQQTSSRRRIRQQQPVRIYSRSTSKETTSTNRSQQRSEPDTSLLPSNLIAFRPTNNNMRMQKQKDSSAEASEPQEQEGSSDFSDSSHLDERPPRPDTAKRVLAGKKVCKKQIKKHNDRLCQRVRRRMGFFLEALDKQTKMSFMIYNAAQTSPLAHPLFPCHMNDYSKGSLPSQSKDPVVLVRLFTWLLGLEEVLENLGNTAEKALQDKIRQQLTAEDELAAVKLITEQFSKDSSVSMRTALSILTNDDRFLHYVSQRAFIERKDSILMTIRSLKATVKYQLESMVEALFP